MIFKKAKMTPNEEKMNEHRNAQVEVHQSLIEYVAIMTDVELPSEEPEIDETMPIGTLSKNGEKAMRYYDSGFWTKSMVYNVTKKGWISEAEYKEITGEKFV